MSSFKNILIPTDFSPNAGRAVDEGLQMARAAGARVHLLHVLDIGAPYIPQGGFVYPIEKSEVLKNLEEIKDRYPELDIETVATMGHAADSIVSYAAENAIDLICMSTHGRRGFSRAVLGSVTEAVVRGAPCPVLSMHGSPAHPRQDGPKGP